MDGGQQNSRNPRGKRKRGRRFRECPGSSYTLSSPSSAQQTPANLNDARQASSSTSREAPSASSQPGASKKFRSEDEGRDIAGTSGFMVSRTAGSVAVEEHRHLGQQHSDTRSRKDDRLHQQHSDTSSHKDDRLHQQHGCTSSHKDQQQEREGQHHSSDTRQGRRGRRNKRVRGRGDVGGTNRFDPEQHHSHTDDGRGNGEGRLTGQGRGHFIHTSSQNSFGNFGQNSSAQDSSYGQGSGQGGSRNAEQSNSTEASGSGGGRGRGRRRGKKRRRRKRNQSACDAGSSGPSRDTPSQSTSGSDQSHGRESGGARLELAGYYYDADKKRYFKIQPGHRGFDESIITQEKINRAKAEEQRQLDLAALNAATSSAFSASLPRLSRHWQQPQTMSAALLGGQYQRGEVDWRELQRRWVLGCASSLCPANTRRVFAVQPFDENLEHMLQMERSEENNKLLCLWSVAGTMVERLQLVTVTEGMRTHPGEFTLEFSSSCTTVLQSWNKITSMCWSDFSQYPGKKYVLYTTMCHTGETQSLAFIRNLDPTTRDQVHFFDFNLGSRMSWTCAWNYHRQRFGVGTEKGCLVVDVNTRRLWQFKTNNSDAISQIFSKEDGGWLMYTGTRNGSILKHDLRSNTTLPVHMMSHKAAVCCLRLSPEENYLYASDFSGKIHKWDVRIRKSVLSYEGLMNKQCKLPFHIDATQSVLYAAGQDCYTKLWCLNTGRLLHSIPPPYEASIHTIPAVQFSTQWAGVHGNIGLVMGAHKSFYLYGGNVQPHEL